MGSLDIMGMDPVLLLRVPFCYFRVIFGFFVVFSLFFCYFEQNCTKFVHLI